MNNRFHLALFSQNTPLETKYITSFFGREKGNSVVSTLGKNAKFVEVDIDDINSLEAALDGD